MSRYHKKITPDADGLIDLYAIAEAYAVKSNPQFHAMKKIMMAGERGHKSLVQDIDEAIIAAQRWKEMVQAELVADQNEVAAHAAMMDAYHAAKPEPDDRTWCPCGGCHSASEHRDLQKPEPTHEELEDKAAEFTAGIIGGLLGGKPKEKKPECPTCGFPGCQMCDPPKKKPLFPGPDGDK